MNRNRYDSRYLLKSSMSVYSFGNNVFQKQFQERKKEIDKNYNSLEKICVLTENKLLLTEKEELTQRCKLLETKLKKLKNNKINDEKIKKGIFWFFRNYKFFIHFQIFLIFKN